MKLGAFEAILGGIWVKLMRKESILPIFHRKFSQIADKREGNSLSFISENGNKSRHIS